MGDGHAMQGDGEVCVTGLEASLEGLFRLTVRKDLGVAGAHNGTSWVPTGKTRPNQVGDPLFNFRNSAQIIGSIS